MTKFGAAENKMKRLMAKFAQGTPTEYPLYADALFGLETVHPSEISSRVALSPGDNY